MSISPVVDLREKFGPARDQRSRPTCLVFAVSAGHEFARSQVEPLSTEMLFYHAVQLTHRDPRRGVSLDAVSEALPSKGQVVESEWPYLRSTPRIEDWSQPSWISECLAHKARLDEVAPNVSEVIRVLQRGSPVLLIMSIDNAMFQPSGGVVLDSICSAPIVAAHAVVAVGHGTAESGRFVLVRNSWGCEWGVGGHAWISESYLNRHLRWGRVVSNGE